MVKIKWKEKGRRKSELVGVRKQENGKQNETGIVNYSKGEEKRDQRYLSSWFTAIMASFFAPFLT